MPANECIPYFEPGDRITARCTAAVTGRRFVAISAAPTGGITGTENVRVAHAAAGNRAFGVSCYDGALNEEIPLIRGNSVVPIESGAAVTAGAKIQSDATGRAITWDGTAASEVLGVAVDTVGAAGAVLAVAIDL